MLLWLAKVSFGQQWIDVYIAIRLIPCIDQQAALVSTQIKGVRGKDDGDNSHHKTPSYDYCDVSAECSTSLYALQQCMAMIYMYI